MRRSVMVKEGMFENLKYLVSYPEGFDSTEKYPLVIFLHGAGTRGDDIGLLKENVSFINIKNHQSNRFILIAPLCSVNNWNEVMPSLINLVDYARNLEYVDIKHVHLTGNSMGGYGTWELCSLRPDWFASIMPVCGGGIKWMAYTTVDVPTLAFHGICDTTVDPLESLEMVKAINRKGGSAQLVLFPNLAHNCWEKVYTTKQSYDWLLAFSTDRDKTLVEKYSGAYYG